MLFDVLGWFSMVLGGFRWVWEGLGWVGRGWDGWGGVGRGGGSDPATRKTPSNSAVSWNVSVTYAQN